MAFPVIGFNRVKQTAHHSKSGAGCSRWRVGALCRILETFQYFLFFSYLHQQKKRYRINLQHLSHPQKATGRKETHGDSLRHNTM